MTHERLVQDAIWLLERQSGVGSQSAAALLEEIKRLRAKLAEAQPEAVG